MSVFWEDGRGWVYEFQFAGERYRDRRGFTLKEDADKAERKLKRRLECQAAGLPVPDDDGDEIRAPRITEWAGLYWRWVQRQHKRGRIKRPERIFEQLTVVLRFWGAKPTDENVIIEEDAPYHDLRLDDPIRTPAYLREFDEWIEGRGVANNTVRHYLTTMSELYEHAVLAENRADSRIEFNPFLSRERPSGRRRTAVFTPGQFVGVLAHASYYVRLAMTVALLAPKLRLENILSLRFDEHFDADLTKLTIWHHKTDRANGGAPLVMPVVEQLREVLIDAQARTQRGYVVEYRGNRIHRIEGGMRGACEAAGVRYGLKDGVTFHSIRHTVLTWLARQKFTPQELQEISGHLRISSVMWYVHLAGEDVTEGLDWVSEMMPVRDITTQPRLRPRRGKRAPDKSPQESPQ